LPTFDADGVPMDFTRPLTGFVAHDALHHPYVLFIIFLLDVIGITNGSTVANYLSAVNASLSRWFVPGPPQSPMAWAIIHRLKQQPRVQRFRDPAPPELIVSVLSDKSLDDGVKLAVSMMWFMSTRVSDTTSHSTVTFDPKHTLLRSDVSFIDDDCVRIFVPHSKSDQFNTGSCHYIMATNGPLCPVQLLRRYLAATARFQSSSPLLRHQDGRNITRAMVSSALKQHASIIGLDAQFISAHSTRIGSATRLVEQGLSVADIMLQGQWVSEQACLRYLRRTRPRASSIARALSLEYLVTRSHSRAGGSETPKPLFPLRLRRE
jgi:hypothetical protein